MTHGSLFSGIGGFDLAAEWMQWENVFHCEWNKFGQSVLKHYWPQSISYEDITKTNFTIHRGQIDVLTGGFPCQPYSTAGKRRGKDDDRHLWPEMLRAIREIQPRWVVGENVRGLVNWNGGLVFDEVQADLEAQGYEVQPFILPACAKDAPHRRDRVWFVARYAAEKCKYGFDTCTNGTLCDGCDDGDNYELWTSSNTESNGNTKRKKSNKRKDNAWKKGATGFNELCSLETRDAADTDDERLERYDRERERCPEHRCDKGLFVRSESKQFTPNTESESSRGELQQRQKQGKLGGYNSASNTPGTMRPRGWANNGKGKPRFTNEAKPGNDFQNFPTESPICGGDDGLPSELDGITFSKWRNESIKAYGNAVVPQVVFEIFKAIQAHDHTRTKTNH